MINYEMSIKDKLVSVNGLDWQCWSNILVPVTGHRACGQCLLAAVMVLHQTPARSTVETYTSATIPARPVARTP